MKPLIQKLVETQGPSGYETQIRSVVREEVTPFADDVQVDALGNLIALKGKGNAEGIKLMLAAHIDEIGVMVTQVDEKGFLHFTTLGGVRPYTCIGGRVKFLNGASGVINMEPLDDMTKQPTFEQLYIDIGLSAKQDSPVKIGDVGTFDRPFLDLGKRLHNRLGLIGLGQILIRHGRLITVADLSIVRGHDLDPRLVELILNILVKFGVGDRHLIGRAGIGVQFVGDIEVVQRRLQNERLRIR